MRKIFYLFSILIVITTINSAQTLYVSDSLTETNEPINAKNNWEIEAWGKTLHVILDTENETIQGNVVYLFIDKFTDGKYAPFDSKSVNIQQKAKRVKYDYNFSETGKYKLYYVNISQEKIASLVVTITQKSRGNDKVVKRSDYYDSINIIFCERILIGGVPIGIKERTSLSENNGEIYVKLTNHSPLRTDVILVDFWRKEHRSFEYDAYIESKKYKISSEWSDTYFKYQFRKPGEYKIVIYNQAEVTIGTGYINVLD